MRYGYGVVLMFVCLAPLAARAQVAAFTFTTVPQTVSPDTSSEVITLEAQDASGAAASGNTICIQLTSSHAGSFSTNTSWSDPLATLPLTLSSNQSRRNFYYRSAVAGSHTIIAKAALRPDGSTCPQWSPASGVSWTAEQVITIGSAGSGTASSQTSSQTQSSATSQTGSQSASLSTPVSSYVPPPEPTIFADAGADRTVIVGADMEFRGRAYSKSKEIVANVRLTWNFGDGTTKEGGSVMHHYDYPGTYLAVLSVAQNMESVSDRVVVRAEPAKLGFFVQSDGSVVIENFSGRELDLSRWIVGAFNRDFILPTDSYILPDASMRISAKTLGFFAGLEAQLKYPNGAVALGANQASVTKTAEVAAPAPAEPQAAPPVVRVSVARAAADSEEEVSEASAGEPIVQLPIAEAAASASAVTSGGSWWLGALGLAGLTGAGAMLARRYRNKEWDIIEDNG